MAGFGASAGLTQGSNAPGRWSNAVFGYNIEVGRVGKIVTRDAFDQHVAKAFLIVVAVREGSRVGAVGWHLYVVYYCVLHSVSSHRLSFFGLVNIL